MRCRAALLPVAEMLLPTPAMSAAREGSQRISRSRRERDRAYRLARPDRALELRPGLGAVTEGRFEPTEVMGDRTPIRAAATEAVEDHVPVGVGLELVFEGARAVAIAERGGRIGEHRDGEQPVRVGWELEVPSGELFVGRPRVLEVAGVGAAEREHRSVRGDLRVLIRGIAEEPEHLLGSPLEESYVYEVHAERGRGFGMFGGRLVRKRLERERLRVVE